MLRWHVLRNRSWIVLLPRWRRWLWWLWWQLHWLWRWWRRWHRWRPPFLAAKKALEALT